MMTHDERVRGWLDRCTVNENGCWLWPGATFRGGYGNVSVVSSDGTRRNAGLHRVVFEYIVGPIPEGLVLDHLPFCRTPACCNPAHLEPVTQQVNLLRGDTMTARRAAVTHCPAGHEYTSENTRRSSRGQRHCVACNTERKRRQTNACTGRPDGRAGAGNGGAKLTAEQARAIKTARESSRVLADRYGVSAGTVRSVRDGKTWAGLAA
jgi:hypothetical protein